MSRCRDVTITALRTCRNCSGWRYRRRQLAPRDPIAAGRRLGRAVQSQPHHRAEGDSEFGRARPCRGPEGQGTFVTQPKITQELNRADRFCRGYAGFGTEANLPLARQAHRGNRPSRRAPSRIGTWDVGGQAPACSLGRRPTRPYGNRDCAPRIDLDAEARRLQQQPTAQEKACSARGRRRELSNGAGFPASE